MNEGWLEDSIEESIAAVLGTLRRPWQSEQQVADLAADAVAFACAQAWEKQPDFKSRLHCRNWLVRVAVNHANQTGRTEHCHRQILAQLHAEAKARNDIDPNRVSPLQPFLTLIPDALAALPEEDRRLITRRFLDGVSLVGIVQEFGLGSIPTACRRVQGVLRRLRTMMEQQHAVPEGWEIAQDG